MTTRIPTWHQRGVAGGVVRAYRMGGWRDGNIVYPSEHHPPGRYPQSCLLLVQYMTDTFYVGQYTRADDPLTFYDYDSALMALRMLPLPP